MFLLSHVLSQQVTGISYVVIWKSTGKCLITSWTRKGSDWYFKRCGLKNYIEKLRENVLLHHVLENQETDISNGCGLKKYRKIFS